MVQQALVRTQAIGTVVTWRKQATWSRLKVMNSALDVIWSVGRITIGLTCSTWCLSRRVNDGKTTMTTAGVFDRPSMGACDSACHEENSWELSGTLNNERLKEQADADALDG